MEARELRIGNWVLHPKKDDIFFCIDREMFGYNKGLANIEDFRPIPLTHELLLKCGFKKRKSPLKGRFAYSHPKTMIYELFNRSAFEDGIKIIPGRLSKGVLYTFTEVKSIHQLQNLHFALTGEELEIKKW